MKSSVLRLRSKVNAIGVAALYTGWRMVQTSLAPVGACMQRLPLDKQSRSPC